MGIIKAAAAAADGLFQDQWKECYYCDAMPDGVMVVRARKRTSENSANHNTNENVITKGSAILVADGQCAIVVDNGRIVAVFSEPGMHTFTGGYGVKGIFKEFAKRVSYGGDAPFSVQRVYYLNTREMLNQRFSVNSLIKVDSCGAMRTVNVSCSGSYTTQITDPQLFYAHVSGNDSGRYSQSRLSPQMNAELRSAFQTAVSTLSAQGIEIAALPAQTDLLCRTMQDAVQNMWSNERGISIGTIALDSVSVNTSGVEQQQQREHLQFITPEKPSVPHPDPLREAVLCADGSFRCSCGAVSEGKFCPECGKPRPIVWVCACGASGTGNYCENCGCPKPEQ